MLFLYNGAVNAQLNAQFNASQLFGCPPLVVNFSDQSTGGATSWSWDFDNGNTSTQQNPTASFSQPNIYNVRLVVSNGSTTDTQTLQIRVFRPAAPNFTAPDNHGCVQPCHMVHFTNQTIPGESPVTQYVWDFGDGTLPVTGYNVNHCYLQPGSFNVTLVVRDSNGCQTSQILPNYVIIGNGPSAAITVTPTQSCTTPQVVAFTGTGSSPNGAVSYAWYFGNGSTSAQQNPTQVYTNGIYDPVLIVTDPFGCQDSAYGHVEITNVQAGFYVSSNNGCSGIPLQFTDTSNFASSWSWNFGDGTTSTLQNPTHAYSVNGTYTVTLTATYNGCTDAYTQSATINVSSPVNFTFAANDTSNCSAPFTVNFTNTAVGATSYQWDFGDGTTSALSNPSHTYDSIGSYTVSLGVSNNQGCVNTIYLNDYIGVGALHADFTFDSTKGCTPMLVHFTDLSISDVAITSYQWDFGDGTFGTGINPVHNYTVGGIFTPSLLITNADGCMDSIVSNQNITIGTALNPVFTADPLVQCIDQPVNFFNNTTGAGGLTIWHWEFGDGTTSTLFEPTHAYTDTGWYDITLIVINQGCPNDTERLHYIEIVVPKADFDFDFNCTSPTTVTFIDKSVGADTYLWEFGDGTTSTQQNPVHTYPSQSNYSVKLTVYNATTGCIDSTTKVLPIGTPDARFVSDTTRGCVPFAVHFSDSSIFASGWLWSFGDGGTSTAKNPTHTYSIPGYYTVKLIINPTDSCRDSIVKLNYITAFGVKPGFYGAPTIGCRPLNVAFHDTSTSFLGTITGWYWSFGTGDTSLQQNPNYIYTEDSTYDVTFYVRDSNGCLAGKTKNYYITVQQPVADFISDTAVCPGESVHFQNLSSGGYNSSFWNFGDGTTSTSNNPVHAYTSTGTYSVFLVVSTSIGCKDTLLIPNLMQVDTPVSDFYVTTTFSPCPPFPVQFYNSTNRTDLNWLWEFGDGDTSTAYNPMHVYFFPGDYDVTLTAWDSSGCTDTKIKIDYIRVRGPVGHFEALPDSGCVPLTVTIAGTAQSTVSSILDLGDGLVLNDTFGVTHVYNPNIFDANGVAYFYPIYTLRDSLGCTVAYPVDTVVVGLIPYPNLPKDTTVCKGNYVGLNLPYGDHFQWTSSPTPTHLDCDTCKNVLCSAPDTVTLFVTASTNIGCVASDTIKINVDKLPPIFPGISFKICHNDTLQLNAGVGVTAATWTPGLYISDSTSVNPKVFPPDSMTYRVTGGNSTGCTISRIVKVYVIDHVVIDLSVRDTVLCQDGMLPINLSVLDASANDTTFKWSPSKYLNADNIEDVVASPPPGNYYYQVIVSSSTCIADTDTVHLVIAPNPIVQAGDEQTVTPGTTIQLYASSPDNVNYHWTDVDPMTCVNCRRPFLTATQNQTVYVRVTNQYGCWNEDSVRIRVVECDPSMVYIPNTFTPNGDGLNDLLLVRGIGLRQLDYFRVYDRWGKLVYETHNLNDGWDGLTGSGKEADVATYVYAVKGLCSSGFAIEKSGNVTLVR